jgi:hypothetical protein
MTGDPASRGRGQFSGRNQPLLAGSQEPASAAGSQDPAAQAGSHGRPSPDGEVLGPSDAG